MKKENDKQKEWMQKWLKEKQKEKKNCQDEREKEKEKYEMSKNTKTVENVQIREGGEVKKNRVQALASRFGETGKEKRERERKEERLEKEKKEREQMTRRVTEVRKFFEKSSDPERKVQNMLNNQNKSKYNTIEVRMIKGNEKEVWTNRHTATRQTKAQMDISYY